MTCVKHKLNHKKCKIKDVYNLFHIWFDILFAIILKVLKTSSIIWNVNLFDRIIYYLTLKGVHIRIARLFPKDLSWLKLNKINTINNIYISDTYLYILYIYLYNIYTILIHYIHISTHYEYIHIEILLKIISSK